MHKSGSGTKQPVLESKIMARKDTIKKTAWGLFGFGVFWHFVGRGARGVDYVIRNTYVERLTSDGVQLCAEVVAYNHLWVSVLVRRLTGKVYLQEQYVGDIDYLINQKVMASSTVSFPIRFSLSYDKVGAALWENFRVGDYRNLLADFDGEVSVGADKVVTIPLREQITWQEMAL